jgi:hypothetical protein
MKFNSIPLVIFIIGTLLLILVQQVLRPILHPSQPVAILLGSAPNLIVGLCFPFGILIRPGAFTKSVYKRLFPLWCAGTLLALIGFEVVRPFKGAKTFDYWDIAASIAGVLLAVLLYYFWLQNKLVFGAEQS